MHHIYFLCFFDHNRGVNKQSTKMILKIWVIVRKYWIIDAAATLIWFVNIMTGHSQKPEKKMELISIIIVSDSLISLLDPIIIINLCSTPFIIQLTCYMGHNVHEFRFNNVISGGGESKCQLMMNSLACFLDVKHFVIRKLILCVFNIGRCQGVY